MNLEAMVGILMVVSMAVTQAIKKAFHWSDEMDTRWIAGIIGIILSVTTFLLGFYAKLDPPIIYSDIFWLLIGGVFGSQIIYDKIAKKDK